MTIVPNKRAESADPGGPVLAVCDGARCAALWRMRDAGGGADAFETSAVRQLRRTIAGTPGGLLIRTDCVGGCAHGAVTAVAHRPADGTTTDGFAWVGGSDLPERHAALRAWVADDWSAGPVPVPAALRAPTAHPAVPTVDGHAQ